MNKLNTWLESLVQPSMEHNGKPNFKQCIEFLGGYFPLLHQFAETEQDKTWHGEGNVAIHTDMVLDEIYVLLQNEASHIIGVRRQALILGALLHDIAKPVTTKSKTFPDGEHVIAPRHEQIGRSYLALRLPELSLTDECCRLVLGLVGYHQLPKLLAIRNQDKAAYLNLASNADMELLYWLEIADMKGRICADLPLQLGYLEEFRMFCEDYRLWPSAKPWNSFLNDVQVKDNLSSQMYLNNVGFDQILNRQIFMAEEAIATTYSHANDYSHFVITCGPSGSGKTSWIKQHLNDFTVISLDDIRREINGVLTNQKNRGQVLQIAKQRLKSYLATKQNVVWDATNLRKDFRDVLCTLGRNYHALVTIVVFQLPISTVRINNGNRKNAVPDDILTKQINQLEWPEFGEGHRLLTIDEDGKTTYSQGCFPIQDSQPVIV